MKGREFLKFYLSILTLATTLALLNPMISVGRAPTSPTSIPQVDFHDVVVISSPSESPSPSVEPSPSISPSMGIPSNVIGVVPPATDTAEPSIQPTPKPPPPKPTASPVIKVAKPSTHPTVSGYIYDVEVSWYGPGFYGKRTACGYALTTTILGVAHRTLPCGTLVDFLYNGRSVTVPVIDRGPYVAGRQWDLTGGLCVYLNHCFTGPIYYRIH